MAGHSHWANIKRKKEAQDKKKSVVFTKAAKLILTAIKEGGPNPETNNALRLAIDYAKKVNMPNSNIERLIAKQAKKDPSTYKEVIYEGLYKNVPLLIRVLTDNTNRSLTEVKQVFNDFGARLAEKGAVAWQFEQTGRIVILLEDKNVEDLQLEILDLIDVLDFDDSVKSKLIVYVPRDDLKKYFSKLQEAGFNIEQSGLIYKYNGVKKNLTTDEHKNIKELVKKLLYLDDVSDVWTGA